MSDKGKRKMTRRPRPVSRRVSESGEDLCPVCSEVVTFYAIGKCDHFVCYRCSTRMRSLCDQMYCAICRTELPKVCGFTITVSVLSYFHGMFDGMCMLLSLKRWFRKWKLTRQLILECDLHWKSSEKLHNNMTLTLCGFVFVW